MSDMPKPSTSPARRTPVPSDEMTTTDRDGMDTSMAVVRSVASVRKAVDNLATLRARCGGPSGASGR